MSVSFARTLKNFWRSSISRSLRQIAMINDTKSGVLVGTDDYGNKFYETQDPVEIHMRTRWVEYKDFWKFDMSQVEPAWHYWLAYGTDTLPTKIPESEKSVRAYPTPKVHAPHLTFTKGAYIPYNTAKPKIQTWIPEVKERSA